MGSLATLIDGGYVGGCSFGDDALFDELLGEHHDGHFGDDALLDDNPGEHHYDGDFDLALGMQELCTITPTAAPRDAQRHLSSPSEGPHRKVGSRR